MQSTFAGLVLDFMKSIAADLARPGGFVPAFRIIYKDGTPMVTGGGILSGKGAVRVACGVVSGSNRPARPSKAIAAPPFDDAGSRNFAG